MWGRGVLRNTLRNFEDRKPVVGVRHRAMKQISIVTETSKGWRKKMYNKKKKKKRLQLSIPKVFKTSIDLRERTEVEIDEN